MVTHLCQHYPVADANIHNGVLARWLFLYFDLTPPHMSKLNCTFSLALPTPFFQQPFVIACVCIRMNVHLVRRGILSVGVVCWTGSAGAERHAAIPDVARIISLAGNHHLPVIKRRLTTTTTRPSPTRSDCDTKSTPGHPNKPFYTVALGRDHGDGSTAAVGLVTRNSIMLLPSFLSPSECRALIDDAEQRHQAGLAIEVTETCFVV